MKSCSLRVVVSLVMVWLVLVLTGCGATVHTVALHPPNALPTGKGVQVVDSRLESDLKVSMTHGSGGGFILVETQPPFPEALQRWVAATYKGPVPFFVGLERLEVLYKVGFATADDLSCGIESQVRAGGEAGQVVRTRVRNTTNMSPVITTAVNLILSQCLEAHAADIAKAQ